MIRVPQRLPDPANRWAAQDGRLVGTIYQYLRELDQAIRHLIAAVNGYETAVPLPSFEVASVPDAADYEGAMVFVTDETGGAVPAFSDGTDWRRVTDRAVIS